MPCPLGVHSLWEKLRLAALESSKHQLLSYIHILCLTPNPYSRFVSWVYFINANTQAQRCEVVSQGHSAFSSSHVQIWEIDHREKLGWRIDAFKLWCLRSLLRILWIARRSNQSILKEVNLEYSLEWLILKLKLQHFGHLMRRADSLEETLMPGKIEDRRRREWQRMRWLDASPTQWTWVWASSGRSWRTGKPGELQCMGLQSRAWPSDWTTNNYVTPIIQLNERQRFSDPYVDSKHSLRDSLDFFSAPSHIHRLAVGVTYWPPGKDPTWIQIEMIT